MTQWIVSSSILILIVVGLRFLLRKRIKPILQYALWALVLVRLLVPLQLGSTPISLQNAIENTPVVQQMELADEVAHFVYHDDGTATGYYEYHPSIESEEPIYKPAPQAFTQQEAQSITRMQDAKKLMKTVWLGGVAIFALIFLLSNLRFALRLRNAQTAGKQGGLPIYITDKVDTPCLFGLLRPAIYLPPAVAADSRHRDYSIAHELTHFRHGDALFSALRCVCIVLHWYNPLVWWAAILSREDGEIACDEATIATLGENLRGDYGRVLVDLTCRKPTDLLQTATTMTGSAKSLKQRINMIVKRPQTAVFALICLILVASVAVGCTFTGGKTPEPRSNSLDTTENTGTTTNTESTGEEAAKTEDIEGSLAQYVQTAMKETLTSVNRYGQTVQSVPVRLPKLLPFSADAATAQAEIQDTFDPIIANLRDEFSKGTTSYTHSIDYSAYRNNAVLSLVIHIRSSIDLDSFYVYSFDVETGKRLDTEALMNKLQIADYTEKFTQAAKTAFEEKYPNFQKNEDYQARLADTVSKENIAKAMPYVAEDGKVMIVVNIYALAGAAYYPEVIPLS